MSAWWLYVVIVMAYYSSNLIAYLTVPQPHWLVYSLRDALRRDDIHIYIPLGTGIQQQVQKSKNEDFMELKTRIEENRGASLVPDVNTAIEPVAAGKAILLADEALLRALIMADCRQHGGRRCRMAILTENIFLVRVGIATRKGSPFVASLNRRMFRLGSSGNLNYMLKDHQQKEHPCIRNYDAEVGGLSKPIGLAEMESAFLLLLFGTALSMLLVPVEFAAHWARTRRRARMLALPSAGHDDPGWQSAWSVEGVRKGRPLIGLQHGWQRADCVVWTTVGPGAHVLTDCYPAFGEFGRRPLFVKEASPYSFYQSCWNYAVPGGGGGIVVHDGTVRSLHLPLFACTLVSAGAILALASGVLALAAWHLYREPLGSSKASTAL
ncbi:glutamate receptor ionotropic, delta-2-like [Haemaphysalis longicornis]